MAEVSQDLFSDVGNERMVLSLALREPDLLIDIASKVSEQDFLSQNHRALYSVLASLYKAGLNSFDLMAVANAADQKKVLELIGGVEYIDALMQPNVDRQNLAIYVDRVLDCSIKYKLFKQTEFIQTEILSNIGSMDDSMEADSLIARSEERLLTVSMESKQVEDALNLADNLRDLLIERSLNPVKVLGLETGIARLDEAINGLTPGSLTVIAARQKGGKSTLMLNMASHIAYNIGEPVLYIDTELSTTEVQMRAVAHLAQVPERFVSNGSFINFDKQSNNVWRACEVVEKGAFYHKYMPGFQLDTVKSMARKFAARYGIKALFFDYIKVPEISSESSMKETQLLGNLSTGLKDLAGQLDIPVVAAAQIKRPEGATVKTRFRDTDIADSDRIGRYCNNLIAIGQKSSREIEEDGVDCGTHRVQILLSRAGVPNYHGIDIHCDFPTYTMIQAPHQSDFFPTNPLQMRPTAE